MERLEAEKQAYLTAAKDLLDRGSIAYARTGVSGKIRAKAARTGLEAIMEEVDNQEKSLIEKEIALKEKLERDLDKLKEAKNPNSIQQALGQIDALEAATQSFYSSEQAMAEQGVTGTNDIGLLGPFNIDIQFAEEYTITIIDAFLTTRGSMIQIDEHAIVEEYSFFARDIKYN